MQKKAVLALLLAMTLLLSSCSLIQKDPAVDAATEIVSDGLRYSATVTVVFELTDTE